MKKLFLILLIALTGTSFSIGNYELFKRYIPKNVFLDLENGKSIKDNLDYYAGLNPDLIYYYINFLDLKINKKISRREDNGYYILQNMVNKSLMQREKWLTSRIQAFNNIPDIQTAKWNINNIYRDFIVDEAELLPAGKNGSPDTNKINYFSYIYFLNDNSQEYDEKKNYSALVRELIPYKIKDINNRILSVSTLESEAKISELKYLLGFWYLMGVDTGNKYLLSSNTENFEIIYNNIPAVSLLNLQIAAGASYYPFVDIYNKNIIVNFKDNASVEMPHMVEFNLPLKLEVRSMQSIALGVNIPIRKERKSFCYLDVRFFYNIMDIKTSQPDAGKELFSYSYYYYVDSTNNSIYYKAQPAGGLKEYFVGLQVSTPLVYLGTSLSVEGGVYYSYYKFYVDYLLYKGFSKSKYTPPTIYKSLDRLLSKNFQESKSKIGPVINIRYKLFKHLDAYLNTLWFQKAVVTPSVGMEVLINI